MTDKQFCKIESAISGEEINKVEQLKEATFTGRELKEYIENFIQAINSEKKTRYLQPEPGKEIYFSVVPRPRPPLKAREKLDKIAKKSNWIEKFNSLFFK